MVGYTDNVTSCVWNPDGTRLATASSAVTKTVGVWDADTGREVATLEGHGGIAHSCAWQGGH